MAKNRDKLSVKEIEIYRSIRTRIRLSTPEAKVISVLSLSKGDGKTEVATKLACSMASAGYKVLLMDGNLRDNDLHREFNLEVRIGLEDLLRGKAEPDECIVKTEVDQLYLLPNIEPSNFSTEILEIADLDNIIRMLKNNYDYVIIDTLAMEGSMEAILLAKASDGALFVAVENESRIAMIESYKNLLHELRVPVLGSIINKAI